MRERVRSEFVEPSELMATLNPNFQFYFIINLAVGGTNGFFPDAAVNEGGAPKPWSAGSANVNTK